MADIIDFAAYRSFVPHPITPKARGRVVGSVRYAGVLLVWLGLLAVRPRLALKIFHERRSDSPLRRRSGRSSFPAPVMARAPEGLIA